jgi:hypothetical protein
MNRPFKDEWGQDPSVQKMRRIFSFMEEAQHKLLRDLNISLLDQRLRRLREQALERFEQGWPLAIRKGIIVSEEDAASFYLHCLARALDQARIEVPKELLPNDEKIIRFLQEERS